MNLDEIKAKARNYSFSDSIAEESEAKRQEFIKKFPKNNLKHLTLDEYCQGTDESSFCYWLEFKKISMGIGGGNASKFGIYKSREGYATGYGKNKKILEGQDLFDFFSNLKEGIIQALQYTENGEIERIKDLQLPLFNMVLQKILVLYYPDKFLIIGASDPLILLANDLNIEGIEIVRENLILINHKCRLLLDHIPEFHDWHYNKIGSFIWDHYRTDGKGNLASLKRNEPKSTINEFKTMEIPESLNLILYGPPGTGKTYHTIDFSVKIAAPDEYIAGNHVANKETFDKLLKEGQVVFTTFHQSMSYEDFIEGIKPMEPLKEGDPVTYKVVDGVFKQLCKSASTLTSTTFELSYEKLLNDLDGTESGFELITTDGEIFTISSHPNGIDLGVESNSYISSITKSGLKYVSDSQKYAGVWGKYYKAIFKLLTENYGYEYDRRDPNKNFVLIIDEINRGNVSEIFGELITLIEDDKRLGGDEAMQIVLPYSKQKFGVPSNIYVLGTMNTADRSVEALDTALRRRFSFIEMMPRYDLSNLHYKIDGYSLSDILKVVNYRIEKLMDRDHQIGHSYFLKVNTDNELQQVFKDKIIPLLQEYFYGDYEKLGLILGSGFIGKNGMEDPGFASFSAEDPDLFDKPIYELKTEPFTSISAFTSAIDSLLNNK